MAYIDIGVNFFSPQLKGMADRLLERASAASVLGVIATGTSVSGSEKSFELAQRHSNVWSTAGVHPHDARHYGLDANARLLDLLSHPRVVAVGECGLDYNRMFSPKDIQRKVFETQLSLAREVNKPLFLHCRDAFDDFHSALKSACASGARGVVHCFTEGEKEAQAYLELGLDLGITGWICDPARGGSLRSAIRSIPLSRMHLETDAPFLRPKTAQKTRSYNEPANLPLVAQGIAELIGMSAEDVGARCSENSRRLFHLEAAA